MEIAEINGFSFQIPKNVKYSFFNSPYHPHRLGTGIDVYFEEKALFPFEEGIVEEIKKIRTPKYVPVREDYLVILNVHGFCLKVLHVKPSVEVNEKLYLGDEFGKLVVSGFFRPWSDRHAHFELRNCTDRYRARGGLLVKPKLLKLVPIAKGNRFEVVEKEENYYWLKPLRRAGKSLTPLTFQNAPLEGGLPHYHYGAVFESFDKVELFGREIYIKEKLANGVGIFDADFEIFVNDQKVKGIGIYCNEERIKLIGGEFRERDIVEITIV
ncbi:hypothetical protein PAP_02955 [Palaeococcus pacificus DY20341]|uniref:Peptidase M23 domain-containing protein n=2 Tax=Palaeococcus TaxID=83867 RepID=A0A075LS94_9EURY|nr:hypothetical protein PAP_02955 [Palaeococcus pacificus DY20341]